MSKSTDTIISAQVPRATAERLRREAARNDRSLSWVLRRLLVEALGGADDKD